ncbi:MAG: hypothetical protein GYA60_02740 [Candidatus Methanofastidiosa archaeon]|nr:hypothetical protein [Candidatus Methanofastidiosa archaeon]
MGPKRSISEVAKELEKDDSLISRWSAKYRWVKRSSDYDEHFNDIKMKEREQNIIENEKIIADTAAKFLDVVGKAIDDLKPEQIKVSDIPRFLSTTIKTERESRAFLLELYERQSEQRKQDSFRIEVVDPEEIRERLKKERENGLI